MTRNTTASEGTFEPGEFVEFEYTARIAGDGTVVDTTDPSVATESGLSDVDADGPITVVLGGGHVFGPVEDAITELRPGESRTVDVPPADAFGEPDSTQRVSIPVKTFPRESIAQNDRVVIDGRVGYVDGIEDGFVTLDFNHPLAGATLEYEIRSVERVVDPAARVDGLLRLYELRDDVTATLDEGILDCSVTRSSVPDDEWDGRKRQFLDAATTHLAVDEVRFEERYPTG